MRRNARTAGVLSSCVVAAAALALAPVARVNACGPPPPLRILLPHADRIVLVGPVPLDRQGLPSDPGGFLSQASSASLRVLETWRGPHGACGPIPLDDGSAAGEGEGVLLLILEEDEDGIPASLEELPILDGFALLRSEVPILREAIRRAEELSGGEDEPVDAARLRAHILESLRHRVTRVDGILEAFWYPEPAAGAPPFRLSPEEALEIGEALARDAAKGEELLVALRVFPDLRIPAARALAVRRIDESLDSTQPVYWAVSLARLLEAEREGCVSESESQAPDRTADAGIEEELPELSGDGAFEAAAQSCERQARDRWAAFRASWPERRRALVP